MTSCKSFGILSTCTICFPFLTLFPTARVLVYFLVKLRNIEDAYLGCICSFRFLSFLMGIQSLTSRDEKGAGRRACIFSLGFYLTRGVIVHILRVFSRWKSVFRYDFPKVTEIRRA
jgi:hypothetical protein